MDTITGIIAEVNNNGVGKGSNLVINGDRYGVYSPSEHGFDDLAAGDEVTVQWSSDKTGKYKNIAKAGITKTGGTGPVVKTNGGTGTTGKFYSKGSFPIDPLDGQRSIIRQNSITNAVRFINEYCGHAEADLPVDTRMDMILDAAQRFEAYSSGDNDRLAAEEASEKMSTTNDLIPD